MKIDGLFEVAFKVKSLEESSKFYQDVLGFKKGLYDEKRRWLFLWVGNHMGHHCSTGRRYGMLPAPALRLHG